ncbi:hypothetical protein [Sphingomonas xinjiangensis]|uniref:Uncharacterized protein n=1 Tax=Sphingomonas xinjiangensis TaxID=643568 RepID=A0A840Y822_9SPHN|nr:hypothetical protein [Sphingomonas xinjiangensis]MBB5709447.1 hypothetical protein [Sphingomonas xinjiangensis]
MGEATKSELQPGNRRNWWKVAFFIAVILLEFTREFAVLNNAEGAQPSAMKTIFKLRDTVIASGRWLRSDGGDQLTPGLVKIECRQETRQCVEASVSANDKYFHAPDLNWFDAEFSPAGVSYVNDNAECARYSVTIDLKQDRAYATRVRKPSPSNPLCANLEPKIAMELGDGYVRNDDPLKGHFVPFLQVVVAIFKVLS